MHTHILALGYSCYNFFKSAMTIPIKISLLLAAVIICTAIALVYVPNYFGVAQAVGLSEADVKAQCSVYDEVNEAAEEVYFVSCGGFI
jgi:hypothetical protein